MSYELVLMLPNDDEVFPQDGLSVEQRIAAAREAAAKRGDGRYALVRFGGVVRILDEFTVTKTTVADGTDV